MSLVEFLTTREKLLFCPICACKLFDHHTNTAIRVCLVHGNIFAVTQTTGGYRVEVDLDSR